MLPFVFHGSRYTVLVRTASIYERWENDDLVFISITSYVYIDVKQ